MSNYKFAWHRVLVFASYFFCLFFLFHHLSVICWCHMWYNLFYLTHLPFFQALSSDVGRICTNICTLIVFFLCAPNYAVEDVYRVPVLKCFSFRTLHHRLYFILLASPCVNIQTDFFLCLTYFTVALQLAHYLSSRCTASWEGDFSVLLWVISF